MKKAWILRDGQVVAAAEIAHTLRERGIGLIGRDDYDGAMILPRTRSVHTVLVRFPIDVAFLDRDMKVVDVVQLVPWRMALPRRRARQILEAPRGSFERWGLAIGDRLEVCEVR